MTSFNSWAATISLTVTASFLLAVHDASYRPAFVQVATMTLLTTKTAKSSDIQVSDSKDTDPNSSKELLNR